MATDMRRSLFGFDPICGHPWNPWLKQAFHSISTCHPPPILEELSFHDVIVVKSRHPLETGKNRIIGYDSIARAFMVSESYKGSPGVGWIGLFST